MRQEAKTPINRLFDQVAWHCAQCGAPAGTCQCLEECSCGHTTLRGRPCRNPATTDCSTKQKYGTLAQQEAWFEGLGYDAATQVLHYIDTMYPRMWEGVSKRGARTSLRHVIAQQVVAALKEDRNTNERTE